MKSHKSNTSFQIVREVKDLSICHPLQLEQILMGPVAQVTLFSHEVHEPISLQEIEQAYNELAEEVAESLALSSAGQIGFFSVNDRRIARWHQFAHVVHDDGTEGFLKIGRSEAAKASLRYEMRNFEVAQALEYPPTIKPLIPYTETRGGLGFFEVEWIDSRDGYTAPNSLLARAILPAEYGRIAAEITISRSGLQIPSDIDTAELRFAEKEIESPEIFLEALYREQKVILSSQYKEEIEQLVGTDTFGKSAAYRLRELFDEVNQHLPEFLQKGDGEKKAYFCINDWGPHTICFCNYIGKERFKAPLVVYFLGFAGKAYNKTLAWLYDWGNFWTRCDPNIAMQQAFLETALQLDPLQSLEKTYNFLRYIIIARTVFVAHALMDKDHPRHDIAASLLQNLIPNLQQFEETYVQITREKR